MTVKELKEKLNGLDENLTVFYYDGFTDSLLETISLEVVNPVEEFDLTYYGDKAILLSNTIIEEDYES